MLPTYKSGDVLIAVKQPNYQVGDPVVYHPKDLDCGRCNVVHRIIGETKNGAWITQGDNNPNQDPWFPTDEEILGKVAIMLPLGGLSVILFSPFFWLTIIFLSVTTFFGLLLKQKMVETANPH